MINNTTFSSIAGGVTAPFVVLSPLAAVTVSGLLTVAITAAVGAAVGFSVNLALKSLVNKIKARNERIRQDRSNRDNPESV